MPTEQHDVMQQRRAVDAGDQRRRVERKRSDGGRRHAVSAALVGGGDHGDRGGKPPHRELEAGSQLLGRQRHGLLLPSISRLISSTIIAFANVSQSKICKRNFLLGRQTLNRLLSACKSCDNVSTKPLYRL